MRTGHPITALVYADSADADRSLRRAARSLGAAGHRLAGVVQRDDPREGRTGCDMILEDLSNGEVILISQDLGPLARGCRLDMGELLRAIGLVAHSITSGADLLILNKFGKTEAEGGGFRGLIVQAVEAGIPVLIGVPLRNLDAWRRFAGELAQEVGAEGMDAAIFAAMSLQGDAQPDAMRLHNGEGRPTA